MRVLAIEKELKSLDPEKARELMREEAAQVWTLQKNDVIREIWFTRHGKCAVILLECSSEAEAKQHLASLPLVRQGFIEFQVQALQTYDGFDRLLQ